MSLFRSSSLFIVGLGFLFLFLSFTVVDSAPRGQRNKLSLMHGLKQSGRAGNRFTPSPQNNHIPEAPHPVEEEDHSKWIVEHLSLVPPFPFGRVFSLPNYRSDGHAVISENYIRLTPDRQNKAGGVWSLQSSDSTEFEVMYEFSISGAGVNAFGEGMAFWLAARNPPSPQRNNFGWSPRWTGLAFFLDTYDNNGDFSQPSLTAVWNDGSFDFHHDSDGLLSQQLGNCKLKESVRNRDKPSRLVVTYSAVAKTIEARIRFFDGTWQKCIDTDLTLPSEFEFDLGVSAQTGQIADNHDLISIKFFDLTPTITANSQPHQVHHHYENDMVDDDLDEGYSDGSLFLTVVLYLFGGVLFVAGIFFVYIWLQKRRGSYPRRGGRLSPLPS